MSTLLIQWFDWTGFDPIASLFIAILIVLSVIPLIRQSASVLMLELDDHVVSQVQGTLNELAEMEGVAGVLQPRFWPNEAESLIGSVHVHAKEGVDLQDVRRRASELLMSHIDGLKEVCVQVEYESAARTRLKMSAQQQSSGFFYMSNPFRTGINYRSPVATTMPVQQPPVASHSHTVGFTTQHTPAASASMPPPPPPPPVSATPPLPCLMKKQTKKE